MTFLNAVIAAVIKGFCTFMPLSEEGHLFLLDNWFNIEAPQSAAFDFTISLVLLIVLAVLYGNLIWPMLRSVVELLVSIFTGKEPSKEDKPYRTVSFMAFLAALSFFMVSFFTRGLAVPTEISVSLLLIVTGFIFSYSKAGKRNYRSVDSMMFYEAIICGAAAGLSSFNGIAFTAVMMFVMTLFRFDSEFSVSYTFVTYAIILLERTIVSGINLTDRIAETALSDIPVLLLCAVIVFVLSVLSVKLLIRTVKKKRSHLVSYYLGILGLAGIIIYFIR
ncbi:MAG: hypothetical protein MJ171_01835 [Clostridia bacterium]|nr:hypothetical protein [Clostridia bacterium]